MNPLNLHYGALINTDKGPAVFIQWKPNNFRNQDYQVQISSNYKILWLTKEQIKKNEA